MTPQLLAGLAAFAFASSITPGPNNTMLMASGANFGFARSAPHLTGVTLGFAAMVLAVGLGLGGVFAAWPDLHAVVQWLGAAYLLYLAWRIATAGAIAPTGAGARPMGFWAAVAFQWVNPKAWTMALGALAAYAPSSGYPFNVLVVAAVFGVVNAPCVALWAGFGAALKRRLEDPRALRAFNLAMAGLLVLSLAPVLAELVMSLVKRP